jgi:glutaredoxin
MFEACPHCQNAIKWMDELFKKHPEYREIPFEMTDEKKDPEYADKFDYYYVPTFYVGEEKVHEGIANFEIINSVFEKAK